MDCKTSDPTNTNHSILLDTAQGATVCFNELRWNPEKSKAKCLVQNVIRATGQKCRMRMDKKCQIEVFGGNSRSKRNTNKVMSKITTKMLDKIYHPWCPIELKWWLPNFIFFFLLLKRLKDFLSWSLFSFYNRPRSFIEDRKVIYKRHRVGLIYGIGLEGI